MLSKLLIEEYEDRRKGVPTIAKETGLSTGSIYRTLKQFGVEIRNCGKQGTDLTGRCFGEWKVLSKHSTRRATWVCRCSCGCEKAVRSSNLFSEQSTRCSNCTRKGCGEITGTLWSNIKNSAGQRGIQFEVTVNEAWELYLSQDRKCALTGLPIGFATRLPSRTNTTASLDRISSSSHYCAGNIQWVYKKINMMKQSYDQDEFVNLCRLVAEYNHA